MSDLMPAVILAGEVPRESDERLDEIFHYARVLVIEQFEEDLLFDKLIELGRVSARSLYVPDHHDADDVNAVIEDELIRFINDALPDGWICTLGDQQPGDVIVREVGHMDDEIRAMGFR